MPKATRKTRAPEGLCTELLFYEAVQMISYRWMIETPDDFVQKAGNEEALSYICRNAARAQIEEFIFVDLA